MSLSFSSALIAAGFVICWSSGFIGGELATQSPVPVLALFAWRFLFAFALAALGWLLLSSQRPQLAALLKEAVIGCLTVGGYLLGVILALDQGVSTSLTALIAALQPLLAAALAGPWLGERLSKQGWLGMGIASIGVLLCVASELQLNPGTPLWAYSLPLLAVLSVTLGSLLAHHWSTGTAMLPTLTVQLLGATLLFTAAALIAAQPGSTTVPFDNSSLAALGWLIVLSTFGGYGFFVSSLRRLGVTRTSTLVYLTPAVTLIWAAWLFDEYPGVWGLVGVMVVSLGVGITLLKRILLPKLTTGRFQESG
ncbi:DMT family transporter [Saccharospirillum sp. HFRX-1]|uniref:DMT family transporter n=1 Tax=unclassified Saccharospirillum TaxID=2633430 RepID=UPI003722677A